MYSGDLDGAEETIRAILIIRERLNHFNHSDYYSDLGNLAGVISAKSMTNLQGGEKRRCRKAYREA